MLHLVPLLGACDIFESTENKYATHADAAAAGAIAVGKWLPTWLPTSAVRIREFHRVDRPEMWVEYFVAKPVEIPVTAECTRATLETATLPTSQHRPPSWWPAELTKRSQGVRPQIGWNVYACRDALVAERSVNGSSRVVIWLTVT